MMSFQCFIVDFELILHPVLNFILVTYFYYLKEMLVWTRAYVEGYFECSCSNIRNISNIRRSLRKFGWYMCKSSFLVKANAITPKAAEGTAPSPHSFWKN